MDAVKFIEEYRRLCQSFIQCSACPAYDEGRCKFFGVIQGTQGIQGDEASKLVQLLEGWATSNTLKSRQDVFLEQYPETLCTENGVISICPATLYSSQRYNDGNCKNSSRTCEVCRREFWNQEVE